MPPNMLSRKQIWRKMKSKGSLFLDAFSVSEDKKEADDPRDEFYGDEEKGSRNISPSTSFKLKSILSSGNLAQLDDPGSKKKKKTSRFSATVHVCLIPERSESKQFFDDLYWRGEDCDSFKRAAVTELRAFAQKHGCTAKEAINRLYQPSEDERDTIEEVISTIRRTQSVNSMSSMSSLSSMDEKSSEFSFISGVKTDVELNEQAGSKESGHVTKSPGASEPQQMWMVSWRKKSDV